MLLEISPDLKLAYELKELYRDFNKRCSFEEAGAQLDYLINYLNTLSQTANKEFYISTETLETRNLSIALEGLMMIDDNPMHQLKTSIRNFDY